MKIPAAIELVVVKKKVVIVPVLVSKRIFIYTNYKHGHTQN